MVTIAAVLLAIGATVVVVWVGLTRQREQLVTAYAEFQQQMHADRDEQLHRTVDTVMSLAQQRLGAEREHESQRLAGTESRIGLELTHMRTELDQMTTLVRQLERNRAEQMGSLAEQLAEAGRQTRTLNDTTNQLRQALSSSQARGQWGERMAEDVLQRAGFLDGVAPPSWSSATPPISSARCCVAGRRSIAGIEPLSKSSIETVPMKGSASWTWGSMPPGITYLPVASSVSMPSESSGPRPGAKIAAIVSPSTRTSAAWAPAGPTTVPPLISRAMTVWSPWLRLGYGLVRSP